MQKASIKHEQAKDCLTCKYEPDWSDWVVVDYKRCFGKCKWNKEIPTLPATHNINIRHITRFSDDSGIPQLCKTWEKKDART